MTVSSFILWTLCASCRLPHFAYMSIRGFCIAILNTSFDIVSLHIVINPLTQIKSTQVCTSREYFGTKQHLVSPGSLHLPEESKASEKWLACEYVHIIEIHETKYLLETWSNIFLAEIACVVIIAFSLWCSYPSCERAPFQLITPAILVNSNTSKYFPSTHPPWSCLLDECKLKSPWPL